MSGFPKGTAKRGPHKKLTRSETPTIGIGFGVWGDLRADP